MVASGSRGWKDVTDDWAVTIHGVEQPAGFVCERGKGGSRNTL